MRNAQSSIIDCASPVVRSHPLNVGRVAWWLCLPGFMGGGKWRDLMSSPDLNVGNHGTLTNMVDAGRPGSSSGWRGASRPGAWGGMLFDGVDDYISSSTSSALTPANALTLAGWCLMGASPIASPVIVARDSNTTNRSYQLSWDNYSSLNRFNVSVFKSGNTETNIIGSLVPSTLKWYRVVSTYQFIADGTSLLNLYINGALDATSSSAVGPINQATGATTIGHRLYAGFPEWWSGQLDDVSIWSRALSPSEILQDYQLSQRGYPGVIRRLSMPIRQAFLPRYSSFLAGAAW